jgi:hypothetical protein
MALTRSGIEPTPIAPTSTGPLDLDDMVGEFDIGRVGYTDRTPRADLLSNDQIAEAVAKAREDDEIAKADKRRQALVNGKLHAGDIAWTKPPPFDFVLPGLQAGEVGMLPAPGGTGKTFLMLQLAMSIATATPFAGVWEAPRKGRVVFLTAEDTKQVLHHRLYYMKPPIEWKDDITENMDVVSLSGSIPRLLTVGKNRAAERGDWFEDMLSLATGARLLIVDPLSRFHSCDENDASQMTMLVQTFEAIAKVTGAAIIFTHHSNKGAQQHGSGATQSSARGSSALTDGVRWQMNLWKMSKEEAQEKHVPEELRWKHVGLTMAKANNIPMDTVTWLERGEGGVLKPSVFMAPGEELDFGKSTPSMDDVVGGNKKKR